MKELICIICPNGCELKITDNGISGNLCKRGEEFANEELTNPKRTLTTTCKTICKDIPLVPVKKDSSIKKELVKDVVKEVNKLIIDKPLKIGDIVIRNVLNTNVNIVLCTNILEGK